MVANPLASAGCTLTEAAGILSRLERRRITPVMVRAVLVRGSNGRAMTPRQHGQTRVYTALDLAEARLVFRLRDREGVGNMTARVIVATLRDQLVSIWRHDDPMALAVMGMRGLLLYARTPHTPRPDGAIAWVPLRAVWAGIEAAIGDVREAEPEIWQYRPRSVAELAATVGA